MAFLGLPRRSRRIVIIVVIALSVSFLLYSSPYPAARYPWRPRPAKSSSSRPPSRNSFDWANRPERFPLAEASLVRLPTGPPHVLPRVQHDFSKDARDTKLQAQQKSRREAVKKAFEKCWKSYRRYAWGYDELRPQTLESKDSFGGWGATLVDALDTLWIMDLRADFEEAVAAVMNIDWSASSSRDCSLFETNIRYLGGLLSAHDLSGEQSLLDKATELGWMLYASFDNKQRMPSNAFNFEMAKEGRLTPSNREISASVGSLSLEFTRLAQLTGEPRFYDAIDRIKVEMNHTQNSTKLPGMWPIFIDVVNGFQSSYDTSFTLGSMADSLYEYLPKMYALLGGLDDTYEKMHKYASETARKHILFRPMVPDDVDILISGSVLVSNRGVSLDPENQHLGCFTGGMYGLGGKLFGLDEHVAIGERLARGCAWSYSAFPLGIMPEVSEMVACKEPNLGPCKFNETIWEEAARTNRKVLPKGFPSIRDRRYILRPEAIESVFIMYRITGDEEWLEHAWRMFTSIQAATETEHANSAIADVMSTSKSNKMNQMESFWLAETLKYFYLIFSDPSLISLDDFVFNTEAHPFKRPK